MTKTGKKKTIKVLNKTKTTTEKLNQEKKRDKA